MTSLWWQSHLSGALGLRRPDKPLRGSADICSTRLPGLTWQSMLLTSSPVFGVGMPGCPLWHDGLRAVFADRAGVDHLYACRDAPLVARMAQTSSSADP